jgi:hypothetical protein
VFPQGHRGPARQPDQESRPSGIVADAVLGGNFGDGHLHDERLLAAAQQRRFAQGLRVVPLESQPVQRQRQRYRIVDAATGLDETGYVEVAEMVRRPPWLDVDGTIPVPGPAGARPTWPGTTPNYVAGDIGTGANAVQVVLRPRLAVDPYRTRVGRRPPVLGGDTTRRGRTRHVGSPRRALGAVAAPSRLQPRRALISKRAFPGWI